MIVGTLGQIGHKGTKQIFAERDAKKSAPVVAENSAINESETDPEKKKRGRPKSEETTPNGEAQQ